MGYTNGDLWNGWATPYFTYEEAQKIQAEINQCEGMRMFYDCNADKFYWQHEDDDEPYVWKGEDIQTVDGSSTFMALVLTVTYGTSLVAKINATLLNKSLKLLPITIHMSITTHTTMRTSALKQFWNVSQI